MVAVIFTKICSSYVSLSPMRTSYDCDFYLNVMCLTRIECMDAFMLFVRFKTFYLRKAVLMYLLCSIVEGEC